ncbi:hypothetical protein ACCO45_013521 [Purpureocillium lilacinum]|uniref:Uncharacterized protein n=1 Tax=Purpureocillium lilacinum TaxID=33203 RepID=A0ACC4D7P7_PURLI
MPRRQDPAPSAPTRKTNEQRVQETAAEAAETRAALVREYFKTHPAPDGNSEEVVDAVIGVASPVFDQLWANADERALREQYAASGLSQEVASIGKSHQPQLTLWKTATRTGRRQQPTTTPSPAQRLWSKNFCTDLNDIVSHPAWEGQPAMLATAIQPAVIRRTGERRRWIIRCQPTCDAMEHFMDRAARRWFDRPVRAAMREAAAACKEQGRRVSPFFRLLCHIVGPEASEPAPSGDAPAAVEPEGVAAYEVRTEDLKSLIEAINTFRVGAGSPYFPSVDINGVIAHTSREARSMPLGTEELKDFYKRACPGLSPGGVDDDHTAEDEGEDEGEGSAEPEIPESPSLGRGSPSPEAS